MNFAIGVTASFLGLTSFFVDGMTNEQEQLINPVSPNFSVTIGAEQTNIKPGNPIRLEIALKNISSQPITVSKATKSADDAAMFYRTIVRDEQGNPAHDLETKLGRKHRTGKDDPGETTIYIGSVGFFQLKPNETQKESFNLSKLYDLKRPGKYTVQLESGPEDAPIKSNVITITVSRQ